MHPMPRNWELVLYQELSVMPDRNAVQNLFLNRELTPQRTLVFAPGSKSR